MGFALCSTNMKLISLLLICISSFASTEGFLLGSPNSTFNHPRRNISCPYDFTFYNGTPVVYYAANVDYCVFYQETIQVNGSSYNRTERSVIYDVNVYRDMALSQCGFSAAQEIGYGSCTSLPYHQRSSVMLCICSTSNCSGNMTTCQASVNQALSSPPLPLIPRLTNTIACFDTYLNYSATSNATPPRYFSCDMELNPSVNYTACNTYTSTHSVLCFVYLDLSGSVSGQMAFSEQSYTWFMYYHLITCIILGDSCILYESTSNMLMMLLYNGTSVSVSAYCFCTTDNCNADFATCSAGINYTQVSPNSNETTTASSTLSTSATPLTSSTRSTTLSSTTSTSSSVSSTTQTSSTTSASTTSSTTTQSQPTSTFRSTTTRVKSGSILAFIHSLSLF